MTTRRQRRTTTRPMKGGRSCLRARGKKLSPRVSSSSSLFLRSLPEVRHYSNDTLVSLAFSPPSSRHPALWSFLFRVPGRSAAPDGAPPFLSGSRPRPVRLGYFTTTRVTRVMAIGMFADDSLSLFSLFLSLSRDGKRNFSRCEVYVEEDAERIM